MKKSSLALIAVGSVLGLAMVGTASVTIARIAADTAIKISAILAENNSAAILGEATWSMAVGASIIVLVKVVIAAVALVGIYLFSKKQEARSKEKQKNDAVSS